MGDLAEVVVARMLGRELSSRQGCLVQATAVVAFALFVMWLFTSGTFLRLVDPFVQWYAEFFVDAISATPRPS